MKSVEPLGLFIGRKTRRGGSIVLLRMELSGCILILWNLEHEGFKRTRGIALGIPACLLTFPPAQFLPVHT